MHKVLDYKFHNSKVFQQLLSVLSLGFCGFCPTHRRPLLIGFIPNKILRFNPELSK